MSDARAARRREKCPRAGQAEGNNNIFIPILCAYLDDPNQILLLWFLRRRKPDSTISAFVSTPEEAGTALDKYGATHDCYWAVGTRSAEYAQKHPELRGGNNDVTGLIGANLDIDIYDPVAHAKKNLPRTIEEALEIANAMPIRPRPIVFTGHGIQVLYLFKELMPLSSPEDRHMAEEVCMRVHAHAAHIAAKKGWVVDSTYDLARVLRVPGTVNRKNPDELVETCIMEYNEHVRYASFHDFLDKLPPLADAPKQRAGAVPDDIQQEIAALNMPGSVDRAALVHACTSSRKFKRTWERKRPDLKDQSNSGFDMALADQAVKQGWPPNQILGLLTLSAQTHNAEIKRLSYYKYTIRKAYEWRTEKEADQDNQSAEPEPAEADPLPDFTPPQAVWTEIFAGIADVVGEHSWRVWLAVYVALCAHIGRKLDLIYQNHSHFHALCFALLLDETGRGKSFVTRLCRQLIPAYFRGPDGSGKIRGAPGSRAGLNRVLANYDRDKKHKVIPVSVKTTPAVCLIPEATTFFKSMFHGSHTHLAEATNDLFDGIPVFTSDLSDSPRDGAGSLTIENPELQILGTTTYKDFAPFLPLGLTNGVFNRYRILPGPGDEYEDLPEIDKEHIDAWGGLNGLIEKEVTLYSAGSLHDVPYSQPYTEDAWEFRKS